MNLVKLIEQMIIRKRSACSNYRFISTNFPGKQRKEFVSAEKTSPLPLKVVTQEPATEVVSFDISNDRSAINRPLTNVFHGIHEKPASDYHEVDEELRITERYRVNLNNLLFSKDRDYLIKYNDKRQVKPEQLAGKVIVVYLVPLLPYSLDEQMETCLIDTYNHLLPNNNFEVVLVAYETEKANTSHDFNPEKQFEAIFSRMPWTAIPFSDVTSRESVRRRCGICRYPLSFVFDSNGEVLQYDKGWLFNKYGGMGYPFNKERIEFLESQDAADAMQPSLRALLASPDRDYVISNNGVKVSINSLEEKVVALCFYEEGKGDWLTIKLKMAYELEKSKGNFEVVLVYLYDTEDTVGVTNEESFWKTFKTMPWLALPFRDPSYRKLKRFFGYNYDLDGDEETPKVVIFGPHGEFVEPWGVNMLMYTKTLAYPFTRVKLAELETEKIKELKPETLWDQNTLLRRKDGTQVQMSQLAKKRIIVFFEGNDKYNKKVVVEFLTMLKERYFYMKGTDDEFEVIHVTCSKKESSYSEHIADTPWLTSLASDLLPVDRSLYCCYCQHRSSFPFGTIYCPPDWQCLGSSALAFDRDGRLVRKSLRLTIEDECFPFYAGGMEKEAFF